VFFSVQRSLTLPSYCMFTLETVGNYEKSLKLNLAFVYVFIFDGVKNKVIIMFFKRSYNNDAKTSAVRKSNIQCKYDTLHKQSLLRLWNIQ